MFFEASKRLCFGVVPLIIPYVVNQPLLVRILKLKLNFFFSKISKNIKKTKK